MNHPSTWGLRSTRVATPSGIREAAVLIRGETIVGVVPPGQVPGTAAVQDLGDLVILPGLVDTHVHLNDPGRGDRDGFDSGTAAAAAGGITTVVDMPLANEPATTTPAGLAAKRAAASGRLRVDCGFFGGLVPGNLEHLGPLADRRVLGFKASLRHHGVGDFPAVAEADLRAAMPILARRGLPLLVHAEIVPPGPGPTAASGRAAGARSSPAAWEVAAIRLLIGLCRETRCRVHVVHLATAEALPLIAAAKAEGLPLTVETCPHYLTFAAEEIPEGDPRFECSPPIRSAADREALWEGLRSGLIDTIGSDDSPAAPDPGDRGPGGDGAGGPRRGIASLQLSLPAVWTEARRRGFGPADLARWMASNPANLVRLGDRKGAIEFGHDADLVVLDPEATLVVAPSAPHLRRPATAHEGRTLAGLVVATYLRGARIASRGAAEGEPRGRPLGAGSRGGLDRLNAACPAEARADLIRCCGSPRWADRMVASRPFASQADLIEAADAAWRDLEPAERLRAYAAHPRIGDLDTLRARFASTAAWAFDEQVGIAGADEATLLALAEGSRDYEARFGHIFLISAAGKSAAEVLEALRSRLGHPDEDERRVVAEEQARITRLRLAKLCD